MSLHVTLAVPVWRRHDLTEAILTQWLRVGNHFYDKARVVLRLAIVGSEPAARTRFAFYGAYLDYPNEPLGYKFNAALDLALATRPDYVVVMGSDQLMTAGTLGLLLDAAFDDVPYAAFADTWMLGPDEAVYWKGYEGLRHGEPVGPGRLLQADVLKEAMPLYPPAERNLDMGFTQRLGLPDVLLTSYRTGFCSVKTPESITPLDRFEPTERMPRRAFLDRFYPEVTL